MNGKLYTVLISLFVGFKCWSGKYHSFALAMEDQAKAAGSASALIGLFSFMLGGLLAPLVGVAGSHKAFPMRITIAIAEIAAIICYGCLIKYPKKEKNE